MDIIEKSKFAWVAPAIAIVAWAGVVYFARSIIEMQSWQTSNIARMTVESEKRAADDRLHAVLQNTKQEREALHALMQTNIVSIVDMIDEVGREAGVKIQISETLSESSLSKTAHTLVFVVHTTGTFSQIVRAARLFETLPIPSTVEQLAIVRDTNGWNLNARVRILTAPTTLP